MGMMDWMDDYDGDDSSDDNTTVATDGLGFDEDLSDEFGDFENGDEFGEEGDFEDGDEFGGGGGGSVDASVVAELEDRIADLENELNSVSSGMNTVREENEQIGETVEELDDTIRKLLDIYEMVTRGINPFVDDAPGMDGFEGGGSFGIFAGESGDESLGPDVANAEAESSFDGDFGELDAEAGEAEAESAAEDDLTEEARESPADGAGEGSEDDSSDGSSFDDLKSEFEENEGWDEESADADAVPTTEKPAGDGISDGETDAGTESSPDATANDESRAFEFDHDAATEASEQTRERSAPSEARRGEPRTESRVDANANADAGDGPEYLTTLPASYTAESVALEWTRFLVSVGGAIGAARALRQYREQGWISRRVERTMNAHVRSAASATAAEKPRDLRVEHHKESLTYISRLAGDAAEARLLEESSTRGRRGGHCGLRR